jgi:5-methylcytosine-specific restriction protein A
MNRRQFIESHGATCKNWNWSWSFVNVAKKIIIFGAWDRDNEGEKARIFTEEWRVNSEGKKNAGYKQSREHIRLIEEEGYQLMTFPMKYSNERKSEDGAGPAKIAGFVATLTSKQLTRVGNTWYASDGSTGNTLPEELTFAEKYPEGAKKTVTINAYERNRKAADACKAHHGFICVVCGFDFQRAYGSIGKDFIHVHHIKPIGSIGAEYEVDPVKDLVPVCPNCHAMIHRTEPHLQVEQLAAHLKETIGRK